MDRREAIAALMGLPATARITRAEVKANDVIVVEVNDLLTKDHIRRFEQEFRRIWPEPQRIVILAGGMRLKVVEGRDV